MFNFALPLASSLGLGGSASGGTVGGGNGWSQGDWNVNVAGSGVALQSGGSVPWITVALVVGAAWLLLKK